MEPNLSRRALLQWLTALGAVAVGCDDDAPAAPVDASAPTDGATDATTDTAPTPDVTEPVDAPDEGWRAIAASAEPEPDPRFAHGVASGDPLPDAVVIWTRVSPDATATAPVDVTWQIADDPAFTMNMREGMARTDATRDWTVKVDVTGLMAGRTYYYRFRALGAASLVGRTRTAPRGATARLRFAVVSCSSYAHGYFQAYRMVARQPDLDAVIHLGDYIYEYATGRYGNVRPYDPPNEIVTLDDYRRRYRHYHRDADLRAMRRQHPIIPVWDDHEFADNAYSGGAENHMPMTEGMWAARKAAAQRAWWEWMPVRDTMDGRIWRSLSYGDLVDLVMLDTRMWGRAEQGTVVDGGIDDPRRVLKGMDQERWFFDTVRNSRARWKIIGQQVMMAQLVQFVNTDQWDGYPEARARFFGLLREMGVGNVVVLTGDIHTSWANDLAETPRNAATYDPASGRGSLAVEFVVPGISSPGFPAVLASLADQVRAEAPHMKYVDLTHRGFGLLDITPDRVQCAWHHLDDVIRAEARTRFAAAFSVANGRPHLTRDETPVAPRTDTAALAP